VALTTPAVTVDSRPKGEPMASTHSPTCSERELPSATTGRFFASIFKTATSVFGSEPSTLARNSRRSASLTMTSLAPRTTCAFVRMTPSGLTMKPDPAPKTGASRPWPRGSWN